MQLVVPSRRAALLLCAVLTLSPAATRSFSGVASPRVPQATKQKKQVPIGCFDPEYHNGSTRSEGQGDKHGRLPTLPAGQTVTRQFRVQNDASPGTKLQVRVQPILRLSRTQSRKLPALVRDLTVPANWQVSLALPIPVPRVNENAGLELVLTVQKQNKERFRDSIIFVAVPNNKAGTQVDFEGRDDKTRGDWTEGYGKEAFLVPVRLGRSAYQVPGITLQRGSGYERPVDTPFHDDHEQQQSMLNWVNSEQTDDPRVAVRGPGIPERSPATFMTQNTALLLRVDATDGKAHRLSLYLLDYKRVGRIFDVSIYDLKGHRLDMRRITNLGEGAFLLYRFTGTVIARIASRDQEPATLSGAFVDSASAEGLLPTTGTK